VVYISDISNLGVSVQKGAYRKVPTAQILLTLSMTSHDPMTSYSWRHNNGQESSHSKTRIRINYPCGPFQHTHSD